MMKRMFFTFLLLAGFSAAGAMDYDDARREAWFLTDKMAYELNLTSEQYDRAYQVNLDYFMSLSTADDCYGHYWTYRDADLRCILFGWQYTLYATLDYFYRPVRWLRSAWYFPIFDRYRRGYYYFGRPTVFVTYRGGAWRRRGRYDPSPYRGMSFRPGHGMRERYDQGVRPPFRPEFGRPAPGGHQRPGTGNAGGQRPESGRPGNSRPGNAGGTRPGRPESGNNSGNRGNTGNRGNGGNRGSGSYRPSSGRGTTGGTYSRPGTDQRRSATSGRSGSGNGRSAGSGRSFGR